MQVSEGVQGGFNMASRGHLEAYHGLIAHHLEAILGASWVQDKPKMGPRWVQDGSKMGSRWSKMSPGWAQDALQEAHLEAMLRAC